VGVSKYLVIEVFRDLQLDFLIQTVDCIKIKLSSSSNSFVANLARSFSKSVHSLATRLQV